ncbi:AraC family ligand binding domain-containing protein [Dictyobacter kobayashii]|uniref:AraC-type arabinose-binding/dimerisation domain-containing protein n=1 Tax=Dictyobacter kobayashii TaxID=2014872 RepID=A0A402AFX8_9CHLR|nr:AraC family ligand binding domain-containing protein [Dictyobacter kobayashii]GCE17992.1 hypothetical protein KDK_17920 [Dictyobacter kobayashii]
MSYSNVDLRETHIIGEHTSEKIVSAHTCHVLSLHHILLAGISYAIPPFAFIRNRPPVGQIMLCLAGRGHVWLDGQWVLSTPGTAYVTPPGVFHGYYAFEDTPWQLAWINYEDDAHSIITVVPCLAAG